MAVPEIIKIGKCIYCGTSDGKLTDEHAIPYGLSGNVVLHEASCLKHADVTSKFELNSLRGLLGRARARLNLKTRRPKLVTTSFTADDGTGPKEGQLDAKQFAGINPLPVFDPPAFLSGQRIEGVIKVRGLNHLNLGPAIPLPNEPPKSQKIVYEFNVDLHAWDFARMIAKIGYCFAVANLGMDKIDVPYVLPSILGDHADVQTWVGSEDIPFINPTGLHRVDSFVKNDIIITQVCLFAGFGGRPYTVVVGKYKSDVS